MLLKLLSNEMTETEFLQQNNIKIIYKKLPKKIYGFIHRYRGINLIIINWNISKEMKKKTLLHEFAHLDLNHLEQDNPLFAFYIENAEDEADNYLKFIEEYIKNRQKQIDEIYMEYNVIID